MVRGTWKRGHAGRGVGGYDPARDGGLAAVLLPSPDSDPDDWAVLLPSPDSDPDDWPEGAWDVPEAEPIPWPDGAPEPLPEAGPEDIPLAPPPAPIPKSRGKGKAPPKLTGAALRRDIHAKIRVVAVPAARVYQIRDPVCGGVAVQIEPGVSDSLADIVMDSPDLIAWFTGPAGGFMKYFDLLSKLAPLAGTVWAHHIAHSIEAPEGEQAPARQYAA
jgi:hypothetical protein